MSAQISLKVDDNDSLQIVVDSGTFNYINSVSSHPLALQTNGSTQFKLDPNGLLPDLTTNKFLAVSLADNTLVTASAAGPGPDDPEIFTNKTIRVTENTVIMDNIGGSPNIVDTVTQQMRTTDNVTFGSLSTGGGVFAGSGVTGTFGNFNTINSQALDNTATVNGINPLTTDTNLNNHIAASTAHGTTSAIVGINDTQRLANKNIAVPSCKLVDNSDSTKAISFNDAAATTGTTLTISAAQTANRALTLPDASDTLVGRGTVDILTNKTIDSGVNTLTLTNLFLTGANINNLIGQAVRSIDSPTFAAITAAIINGNTNLAINAGNITATTSQPASLIVNNTSATFSNELRIQNNGTTIVGFGNNNTSNEAFVWAYANVPLRFATNSVERMRIPAAGIANDNTITNVLGLQGTSLVFKNNLADTSTAQTFTNKTLVDNSTSIVDNTDNTKRILFDAGGTTGTSTTLTAAQTANRAITLPDATTTLDGINNTATLTNKTLDSAGNTLTITNAPLAAANVNTLINQDVRTTASPTFSGINYFLSATKVSTATPVSLSQAAGATTTLLSIPIPTNSSAAVYVYLSLRKITGVITGYSSYSSDVKCVNLAGTLTQTNGNNSSVSQTAIAGAYAGKATLAYAVSGTNLNVNVANTFVDGTCVWGGEIDVIWS